MKAIRIIIIILLITNHQSLITLNAQIAINTDGATPDASAMLDVSSTDKGILIPRMDSTSRQNISNPATGLMVYDTTTITFWYYDNSQWNEIRNGSEIINGYDIFENLSADLSCIETVASLGIGQNPTDMAISGNYAYVIDELNNRDLEVIDISTPSSPTLVQTFIDNAFSCPLAISISGNYAYIADRCSTSLIIVDISNPLSPTIESETTLGNTPNNVILSGNYAYVLETTSGGTLNNVEIIDISTPSSPTQVHSFQSGSKPVDMVIEGNYAYIIDENSNDLKVWDISSVTSPSLVDFQSFGQAPYGISIVGSYAYVVGNVGLKVVDISDPTDISVAKTFTVGVQPYSISASDNYLYIIDYFSGELDIVDISTPTAPTITAEIAISTNSTAIDIEGNYAYIVDQTDDDLRVVNIEACPLFLGVNTSTGALEAKSADNLWSHKATQNIELSNFYLSNDGDDEGISIDNDGNVSLNKQLSVTDTVNLSSALIVNGKDLANTAFTSENGITHNINNSDDFIIGVDSINYNSGSEIKMFFDKGQGAFRTGRVNNTNWNEDSLGLYSFATGNNTLATGSTSAAFGYLTTASGTHSIAGGNQSEATANLAFAYGREMYARSFGEIALGLYGTDYTPNETLAFDENDRLFSLGNGSADNSRSDAMVVYKNGDTEINGAFHITNEVQSTDFAATIENPANDNTYLNNGLEIIAGHDVHNSSSNSSFIRFSTPNGTLCGKILQSGNNSIQTVNTSDIRLKENIKSSQYGLSDILKIKVRDYNYKLDPIDNVKTGFLAQQIYEIFPTAVAVGGENEKTNPWMVDYSSLTPLLVKGMQDQQQIIEDLKSQNQQQKSENENLKHRVTQLEQQVNKINELEAKLEALLNTSHEAKTE